MSMNIEGPSLIQWLGQTMAATVMIDILDCGLQYATAQITLQLLDALQVESKP